MPDLPESARLTVRFGPDTYDILVDGSPVAQGVPLRFHGGHVAPTTWFSSVVFDDILLVGFYVLGHALLWMRNESINIIALSVSTFLLMESMDWDALFARVRGRRFVILSISKNSVGIYFVHVIVLEALAAGWLVVRLDGQSFLPFVAGPLIAAITIAISTAITATLKKIPVLRHAVP